MAIELAQCFVKSKLISIGLNMGGIEIPSLPILYRNDMDLFKNTECSVKNTTLIYNFDTISSYCIAVVCFVVTYQDSLKQKRSWDACHNIPVEQHANFFKRTFAQSLSVNFTLELFTVFCFILSFWIYCKTHLWCKRRNPTSNTATITTNQNSVQTSNPRNDKDEPKSQPLLMSHHDGESFAQQTKGESYAHHQNSQLQNETGKFGEISYSNQSHSKEEKSTLIQISDEAEHAEITNHGYNCHAPISSKLHSVKENQLINKEQIVENITNRLPKIKINPLNVTTNANDNQTDSDAKFQFSFDEFLKRAIVEILTSQFGVNI